VCTTSSLFAFTPDIGVAGLDATRRPAGRDRRLAVRYGLHTVPEFFPWTAVPNLDVAIRVVNAPGRPGIGVLVDTRHLDRSGSSVKELSQMTRSRLRFAHVADAPV
jgi:sugar phosphate isomerase/epimerase